MPLLDRIQKDMVEAMKAKDEARLSTVRMIKTALMKYKADKMKEPDEAAEQQILNQLLKQRHESADMFRKGGREDSALKEEAEAKLVEGYMPAMASADEITAAIDAAVASVGAGPKNMGPVMNAVKAALAGKRVDGRALSEAVKTKLG
ncbi:MAG: GatB/YqeY domain-containing protein [Bryobacteraceae bacterium]